MRCVGGIEAVTGGYDLVIVGAGPAGMSAAVTAAQHGVETLVVDENATPGGQIYRGVTSGSEALGRVLGADYRRGAAIATAFAAAAIDHMPGGTVWSVTRSDDAGGGFDVGVSLGGRAGIVAAKHVLLASGAIERPFCVPGWTLPGVMTAGAAQIALKSAGLVPAGRIVVAGSGPLLYLLAAQLRAAGADIVAFVDTTPSGGARRSAPFLLEFVGSPYLLKGLRLLSEARRAGRLIRGATSLRIAGTERAEALIVTRGARTQTIACDLVLLHHGVIPAVNMPNAIGCAQHFDAGQHCWVPDVDAWFASSLDGVSIAGDAAGIGGAESAALRGTIAALGVARRLGRLGDAACSAAAAHPRHELARAMRGRRFLDALYRPSRAFLAPAADDAIACRCEEITIGQIREITALLGVTGPNQLKAFLRCGMGPCQGRLCGSTVTEVMAETRRVAMQEIGTYRLRPPFKPVTVGEIASLPKTEAAIKAVVR